MPMIADYRREIIYFAKKDPAPPPPRNRVNFSTYSEYEEKHPHLFTKEAIEMVLRLFDEGNDCKEMQRKLSIEGFSMNRNCLAEILNKHSKSYRENGWLISKNIKVINFFKQKQKELKDDDIAAMKTYKSQKITKSTLADILSKAGVKFNFYGYEKEIF